MLNKIGTGIVTRLAEVEVVNDERGAPKIYLRDKAATLANERGIKKISVSLSHSHDFATAVCIVE